MALKAKPTRFYRSHHYLVQIAAISYCLQHQSIHFLCSDPLFVFLSSYTDQLYLRKGSSVSHISTCCPRDFQELYVNSVILRWSSTYNQQLPRATASGLRSATLRRTPVSSTFSRFYSDGAEEKVKGPVIGIDLGK